MCPLLITSRKLFKLNMLKLKASLNLPVLCDVRGKEIVNTANPAWLCIA